MDYSKVAFPKQVRVRNRKLLAEVRKRGCLTGCPRKPVDAHHVVSRKAGGGDTLDNVVPLCRIHHTEWHQQGASGMSQKYPSVQRWLENAKVPHEEITSSVSGSARTRAKGPSPVKRAHAGSPDEVAGEVIIEAAAAYLKAHGWHVLVAGGICVQKQPGSSQYSYELVIGFTGAPPRNDN